MAKKRSKENLRGIGWKKKEEKRRENREKKREGRKESGERERGRGRMYKFWYKKSTREKLGLKLDCLLSLPPVYMEMTRILATSYLQYHYYKMYLILLTPGWLKRYEMCVIKDDVFSVVSHTWNTSNKEGCISNNWGHGFLPETICIDNKQLSAFNEQNGQLKMSIWILEYIQNISIT